MTHIEKIKSKIISPENLNSRIQLWKSEGRKIVFTNGCFDLLHLGHVDYLAKAADCGNWLIIGLNADESVRKLKGEHRPITDENSRAMVLASLEFVNAVILFHEDTPYELIKKVQPDVLVKGGDYKPENIVGYDVVMQRGGEVKIIDFVPGYSTSAIETKIRLFEK